MERKWGRMSPHHGRVNIDFDSFSEEQMKTYFPKKWATEKGILVPGKVYTYNELRGEKHDLLKPGDEVRLLHTRADLLLHVEVEPLDGEWQDKIHVLCLLLGGEYGPVTRPCSCASDDCEQCQSRWVGADEQGET